MDSALTPEERFELAGTFVRSGRVMFRKSGEVVSSSGCAVLPVRLRTVCLREGGWKTLPPGEKFSTDDLLKFYGWVPGARGCELCLPTVCVGPGE